MQRKTRTFTINTQIENNEFICKADRFMFIDYRKDALTVAQFLMTCIPAGTFHELKNILDDFDKSGLMWAEYATQQGVRADESYAVPSVDKFE